MNVKEIPHAAALRVQAFIKVWRDVRGSDPVICRTGAATKLYIGDIEELLTIIGDLAGELGKYTETPKAESQSNATLYTEHGAKIKP